MHRGLLSKLLFAASPASFRAWARGAVVALSLAGVGLGGAGCQRETKAERGPDEVVRAFLTAMQAVHGDPAKGAAVVPLLWKPARENLEERARRAGAATGSRVDPGQMLAPSWFTLRSTPESFTTRFDGDWAEVTLGSVGEEPQYKVRCVKEEGRWRVVVDLPPLPPIRKRLGGLGADDAEL